MKQILQNTERFRHVESTHLEGQDAEIIIQGDVALIACRVPYYGASSMPVKIQVSVDELLLLADRIIRQHYPREPFPHHA